ncbi:UNVERIFIED_CONTAM: hypothetical protein GTU68_040832 [Idotea baltica]|nr:hypothetical protein [Idotea baltica]
MESEGGGWTVLVKRGHEKSENFTRSWTEYEKGFGHPEGEYWIGRKKL